MSLKWRKQGGRYNSFTMCTWFTVCLYYFNNNLYTLFLTYLLLFVNVSFWLNGNGVYNRDQTVSRFIRIEIQKLLMVFFSSSVLTICFWLIPFHMLEEREKKATTTTRDRKRRRRKQTNLKSE